jgi:hypothetical protein
LGRRSLCRAPLPPRPKRRRSRSERMFSAESRPHARSSPCRRIEPNLQRRALFCHPAQWLVDGPVSSQTVLVIDGAGASGFVQIGRSPPDETDRTLTRARPSHIKASSRAVLKLWIFAREIAEGLRPQPPTFPSQLAYAVRPRPPCVLVGARCRVIGAMPILCSRPLSLEGRAREPVRGASVLPIVAAYVSPALLLWA